MNMGIGLVRYKRQHHIEARLKKIASEGGLILRYFNRISMPNSCCRNVSFIKLQGTRSFQYVKRMGVKGMQHNVGAEKT